MRKLLSTRMLTLFAAALLCAAPAFAQNDTKAAYVDGELLVKFRDGAESLSARSANALMSATVVETLGNPVWQRIKLPKNIDVETAIGQYKTLNGVEYAQPNFYYRLLLTPNDPQYTSSGMYGLGKISAPGAWDLSTGSSSVVVADIDTGLGYSHQDIAANAWTNTAEFTGAPGFDDDGNGFIDDIYGRDVFNNDSNPIDDNPSTSWHGTHTAGTIGAAGNNALGLVGVNWTVKIMSLKLYATTGGGTNSTSAMLVNAYAYIRMMKLRGVNIRATNNSYGGCGEACGYDQATKDALDAMGDADIVNVFAAGNDGVNNDTNPSGSYPSVYTSPSIIAVASSTSTDARSSFSSYGLTSVDLAAPGSGVLSTTFSSTSSYGTLSGTSMATPHVTGAVALLAAYRPTLSAASLKATILNNVDPLAAWTTLVKTGGRLNVQKALQNPTVCTFNTPMNAIRVRAQAGDYTLPVSTLTNCDYMVKSNSPSWLTINGPDVFSGNGSFTFRVTANATNAVRTGVLSFGGRTFTVVQRRR